jgi:hypothetical protein
MVCKDIPKHTVARRVRHGAFVSSVVTLLKSLYHSFCCSGSVRCPRVRRR